MMLKAIFTLLLATAPPVLAAQTSSAATPTRLAQFRGVPGEPDPVPPPPPMDDPQDWEEQEEPAPAQRCQKMCENDFSPCDPVYFKTADGRCDDPFER